MNYLMTRNIDNTLDSFIDNMFGDWGTRKSYIPSVDVYEDSHAYHVDAELAGYRESDVNVNIDKHVLHISSEKMNEKKDQKYLIRERSFARFDRAFTLPEDVNEEDISATFKDGVLSVTLPKKPVEEAKKISIKIN